MREGQLLNTPHTSYHGSVEISRLHLNSFRIDDGDVIGIGARIGIIDRMTSWILSIRGRQRCWESILESYDSRKGLSKIDQPAACKKKRA